MRPEEIRRGNVPEKLRWLDETCHTCGEGLNSWDAKCSDALRYKYRVCEKCIAKEYEIEVLELRDVMEDFFGMRPCQGI